MQGEIVLQENVQAPALLTLLLLQYHAFQDLCHIDISKATLGHLVRECLLGACFMKGIGLRAQWGERERNLKTWFIVTEFAISLGDILQVKQFKDSSLKS